MGKWKGHSPPAKSGIILDMARFDRGAEAMLAELDAKADAARKVFRKLVADFLAEVIALTPVDTGFCRASWRLLPLRDDAAAVAFKAVNGAHYSTFLEYGTYKMRVRPMVGVALPHLETALRGALARIRKA